MTVAEYVQQANKPKCWLCPNLIIDGKIGVDPILSGIECTPGTIPDEIKEKEVVKHFFENGFDCIIWKNVEEEGPTGMTITPTKMAVMGM